MDFDCLWNVKRKGGGKRRGRGIAGQIGGKANTETEQFRLGQRCATYATVKKMAVSPGKWRLFYVGTSPITKERKEYSFPSPYR